MQLHANEIQSIAKLLNHTIAYTHHTLSNTSLFGLNMSCITINGGTSCVGQINRLGRKPSTQKCKQNLKPRKA